MDARRSANTDPIVVITDCNLGSGEEIEKSELGEAVILRRAQARTARDVIDVSAGALGLLVQWAPITEEVFEALPSLRYLVRYGIGLDNIDLPSAMRHGVEVRNVEDYCIDEVAGHATAMIMCRSQRLQLYDAQVKAGTWSPDEVEPPLPRSEERVGIVGLGRIGRLVAGHLVALGYPVAYWDPYVVRSAVADLNVTPTMDLLELATVAQHLSLHLPATAETIRIIDERVLGALGPHGHLVNTSRGALVDEAALLACLDEGRLGWASLDVLAKEPPTGTSAALAAHKHVTASPHVAYRSTRSPIVLRRQAAATMRRLMTYGAGTGSRPTT